MKQKDYFSNHKTMYNKLTRVEFLLAELCMVDRNHDDILRRTTADFNSFFDIFKLDFLARNCLFNTSLGLKIT
jgi:hypothetical protein